MNGNRDRRTDCRAKSFILSLILMILVAVSLCLSGCGSTGGSSGGSGDNSSGSASSGGKAEDSKEEAEEIKLIESGQNAYRSDSDVYMNCGFIIENPNEETAFEYPTVTVTAYDKKGEVLTTQEQTMMTIQPGERQAFCITSIDCSGEKPDSVEYEVDSGEAIPPSDEAVKSTDYEISGTNERIDKEYDECKVTGKIKNTSPIDTNDVAVTVLFRKNGKIVYAGLTFVENLKAGKEKAFEIAEWKVPKHDAYEVSAVNWSY